MIHSFLHRQVLSLDTTAQLGPLSPSIQTVERWESAVGGQMAGVIRQGFVSLRQGSCLLAATLDGSSGSLKVRGFLGFVVLKLGSLMFQSLV